MTRGSQILSKKIRKKRIVLGKKRVKTLGNREEEASRKKESPARRAKDFALWRRIESQKRRRDRGGGGVNGKREAKG